MRRENLVFVRFIHETTWKLLHSTVDIKRFHQ